MLNKIKAFTLAELLIVLVALGVMAVIIVPAINSVRPDEGLLKFKKSYYNLQRVTNALLNSEYYPMGDLTNPQNLAVEGRTAAQMHCLNFTQFINTKEANCLGGTAITDPFVDQGDVGVLDEQCNANNLTAKFVTQDDVIWWGFGYSFDQQNFSPSNGYRRDYSIVCFDVDDLGSGEAPFGFGVRNDGKVIVGERAQNILSDGAKRIINNQ